MTDITKAIAAAREALAKRDELAHRGNRLRAEDRANWECAQHLRVLLAAIDAARGEAVAWQVTVVDNTGTHDYAKWAGLQAPPAAAVKKYMNWQPIETAPKDGCVIMLWCGDVDFGYYSKAGWRICNNGDYRDGGHGQDYLCGTDPHSQYAPPTHWMPLPEPPKDAECSPEGVP